MVDSEGNDAKQTHTARYFKCSVEYVELGKLDDLLKISNEQAGLVLRQLHASNPEAVVGGGSGRILSRVMQGYIGRPFQ
jgi:hypothetical protein